MRQPISSISAIAATAVLSLSPVAIAHAYPADDGPGSGGGTASSVDVGAAKHGGVPYEPEGATAGRYDGRDLGYNSQPGVPTTPDLGEARNGIVTPEPTPAPPAPVDTGIDNETLTIAASSAAAALLLGIGGFVFMRRRRHDLPHAV